MTAFTTDRNVATAGPMRHRPQVFVASAEERAAVIDTLTVAFASDNAVRWLYPDPNDYLRWFPRFVAAFGGSAFAYFSAHRTLPTAGAALWYPPGKHADAVAIRALLEESIAPDRSDSVFAVFEAMDRVHPSVPHWYLPLIGVDPIRQCEGHGSALLGVVLERCDHEQMPAYLEATSVRNASLYRRHGFEPIAEIPFPGGALVPMWRTQR